MNARSEVKKASLIHDVIADYRLDVAAITETWIPSDAPNAVSLDIALSGYRVCHAHRGSIKDKHGGGIAIIYRVSLDISTVDVGKYGEFESLSVKLACRNSSITIVCIYRPPGNVSTAYCEQLSDLFNR